MPLWLPQLRSASLDDKASHSPVPDLPKATVNPCPAVFPVMWLLQVVSCSPSLTAPPALRSLGQVSCFHWEKKKKSSGKAASFFHWFKVISTFQEARDEVRGQLGTLGEHFLLILFSFSKISNQAPPKPE